MGKYNKAVYPLLILVIGILVLYYINNVSEGFNTAINAVPLIASSTVPNSQEVPIYLLMDTNSKIKMVPLKNPDNFIKDVKISSNNIIVTLKEEFRVHDFVASGFTNTWGLGLIDGNSTISLTANTNNKVQAQRRQSTKNALSKLPQRLTTFTIGPFSNAMFGTKLDVKGDPANDKGKVSGPANIRIDLLLSK